MNLLIEQRPTTITSSKSQQQQSSISNEYDMNNSSSSSPLVLKIKRNMTKQQQNDFSSASSHISDEDNNSRSTTSNQRLKRTSLPNTTATRRPSSPAFNGKQQQTVKRSVTIDNNNNDLTSNADDISATKRFKRDESNSSSNSNKTDACVETVSIGLATEPDHLGPCEPGTSVVLEGIVWNETDSGVLVVNVTWRGKTYVGTLLDSTKQDWACPRLTCESPTSDYDARSNSKTSRTKRTSAGGNNRSSNQQSLSLCQQMTSNQISSGIDDRKLRNNTKLRQSRRLNNIPATINEEVTNNTSPLASPFRTNNQTFFPSETTPNNSSTNSEPQLIPCTEPQCHKRFTSNLALTYHISNAHKKSETTPTVPLANTRDEEDVAHILANVADYVRRSSPPSSIRCSPDHNQQQVNSTTNDNFSSTSIKPIENCSSSTLSWPCPQISSKLVLSSPLNNAERAVSPNNNLSRCKLNKTEMNIQDSKNSIDQDDIKPLVKPADHVLLHVQDEPVSNRTSSTSPVSSTSYVDANKDRTMNKNSSTTPPPQPPPSSSPAYSDISDEEPTSNEQTIPPSTINLLAATNGKIDENVNNLLSSSSSSSSSPFIPPNSGLTSSDMSNPAWTAQMFFQQFGPFMQQQALATAAASNTKETTTKTQSTTPNRLNSNNTCPSSNGTSDSTVKNILDARRSLTTKPSTSPPLPSTNLYHYHTNEAKFPTPIINTLTSPNENLLHLSTTSTSTTIKPMDILDYSLNNNRTTNGGQYPHSSSLHPSR